MPLSPGESLSRYEILSTLGAGGMGEVYLAKDARLNRQIALKILPENIAADKDRVRRFELEAQAVSALNHPNILTVYEIGQTNKQHFIAMEYIQGETLRRKLQAAHLGIEETLDIAAQIAAALDAAHRSGVVHRDIKPENIMVREDGLVKVLDFGLAKLTEKKDEAPVDSEAPTRARVQTTPGRVMGTARYMSPEQARGKEVDARTDIFSLGVVMYEMLTGQQPFAGKTMSDVIAAILKTEPAPISLIGVPKDLERIVSRALRKNPDERYQHIKDLLIDLKDLKQDLEFEAKLKRVASSQINLATDDNRVGVAEIQNAETKSSAEFLVSELSKRKFVSLITLAVLLLGISGSGFWYFSSRVANTTQIESIAVLPFVNQSGNADTEYLSDGMTESLISSLSQLPKLNVKASSSVFRYKGRDVELKRIGQDLSVQAVLTGRVVQRGRDLTLYIQLVDAATEKVLWSENYNRSITNLVALQNEIARDVSNKLRLKLSGADERKLAKNYTENAEAYRLYLQGRYFWNKRTEKDIRKSIEYFNQAVALDANYALAYAGIADAYCSLSFYIAQNQPENTFLKAREPALRALEIDSELAEAHAALGFIKERYDWDFAAAESQYKRAIELNPDYATARHRYGVFLSSMGRSDEAIAELELARRLDPLSLIIATDSSLPYSTSRRHDRAVEILQKALEIDPNFGRAHQLLSINYRLMGRYEEAIAEFEKALELTGGQFREDGLRRAGLQLALLYHAAGRKNEAKRIAEETLAEMNKRERRGEYVNSFGPALYYANLGDKEQAFKWLEKAFEQRLGGMVELKVSPQWDKLRDDPRFQDLVRRVGHMP